MRSKALLLDPEKEVEFIPDSGQIVRVPRYSARAWRAAYGAGPYEETFDVADFERVKYALGQGIMRPIYAPIGMPGPEIDTRMAVALADLWDRAARA